MAKNKQKTIIVVTGGAGFIGSRLCEALAKDPKNKVISFDNYFTGSKDNHIDGVDYREGHTKDIEKHISETPKIVYHLGEYSRVEKSFEEPDIVWDLNTAGTFFVLEFCRNRGCKIVYAGSSTKFGDDGLGINQSPYAWSKAANTELVKNYGKWFGVPHAITYFYNVYGPGERAGVYGTVIEIFRQQYISKKPLTVVSPGSQKRYFTHVKDVINGLLLVGEKGNGDEFGLGDKRGYTVLEIAKMFGGEITMLPQREGNRTDSSIYVSKTEAIGWSVQQSVEDYIKEITS